MSRFCGFDFGTSNSTIGICREQQVSLVPLEQGQSIIRSAIFCNAEEKTYLFGQDGIDRYLNGTAGRLMMALKSVLGSSLMEDETLIFNEFVAYKTVLGFFMRHIKQLAEQQLNEELTQVVLGRPVHFHDTDPAADKQAQQTMEDIARSIGFKDIAFQYEPIAAALTYETSVRSEQLALIIDMGGGTSDFSIIRLYPGKKPVNRSDDVLANTGIHIAGTDFDHSLSMRAVMPLLGYGSQMRGSSSQIDMPASFYHDLTTWHTLVGLYSPKTLSHLRSIRTVASEPQLITRLINVLQDRAGHHLLDVVEKCKQRLSDANEVNVDLTFVEDELHQRVTVDLFNESIEDQLHRIMQTIHETMTIAKISPAQISAIFYTGGSTKIPVIQRHINALFPHADIIHGDVFGSVGAGLTIDAMRKFEC